MFNRSKSYLVSLVVGLSNLPCVEASAAVQADITILTDPFGFPDEALTGFTAYQVNVATTDDALISAIDVAVSARLHQRWVDIDFDNIPDPTPNGLPADGRADSHLTMVANALVSKVSENNNVFPSPLPDGMFDYGVGNSLAGAWGIPTALQSSTATVAYLVVPDDRGFVIQAAVATSSGSFQTSFPLPLVESEPTEFVATATKIAPPFLAPEASLTGFVAYQLDLHAIGHRISDIDISINGPMHQRWSYTNSDSSPDPTPTGNPADGAGDSHITPPLAARLLGSAEDNNVSPSPLPDGQFDYGVGSSLSGSWSLAAADWSADAQLAYIIIPEDYDPRQLDIRVKVTSKDEYNDGHGIGYLTTLTTKDFFVPEPGTITQLLVFAALGMAYRRRRIDELFCDE